MPPGRINAGVPCRVVIVISNRIDTALARLAALSVLSSVCRPVSILFETTIFKRNENRILWMPLHGSGLNPVEHKQTMG